MGVLSELFQICSKKIIDTLEISIKFTQNNTEKIEMISIPIVRYEKKNEYFFPLKGHWIIQGNWDDLTYHRKLHSQEFAFDVVGSLKEKHWSEIMDSANNEFDFYNAEVHAIADGVVVDYCDDIPDHARANSDYTNEELNELLAKYGYASIGAGNYVTLKHANDEYSFYAHLIPGSITVKKNDKVKQGQIIGNLGNSGNSEGPHLHFQLMNEASNLTGRGLPCYFSNIKDQYGQQIELITQNYSNIITFEKKEGETNHGENPRKV